MKPKILKHNKIIQSKLLKINSKINAFTVSEIVIVLILSSIVVGLAFSVLTLVQKHMTGIQYNFTKNTELNKLDQSLSLDFNKHHHIYFDEVEQTLKFKNELDSVEYLFDKTKIIKSVDTFLIEIDDVKVYFDGYSIINGNVDALKITTSKAYQNQLIFIFKENDAAQFLN